MWQRSWKVKHSIRSGFQKYEAEHSVSYARHVTCMGFRTANNFMFYSAWSVLYLLLLSLKNSTRIIKNISEVSWSIWRTLFFKYEESGSQKSSELMPFLLFIPMGKTSRAKTEHKVLLSAQLVPLAIRRYPDLSLTFHYGRMTTPKGNLLKKKESNLFKQG